MAKVLIVGSGAREHAFANALSSKKHVVISAPGNPGLREAGPSFDVKADNIEGLVELAKRERPDLVFVGPEVPLTLGIVDRMAAEGILAFGPSGAAATLEGSKVFMKEFLARHSIPTAAFRVFSDAKDADAYVRAAKRRLVVKADGLCAGKGVVVAKDEAEALAAIDDMMRKRVFGGAGERVVIEELLPGREASFHVICDGERAFPLPAAEDHKQLQDGDRGPNTGGMGVYAPSPVVGAAMRDRVMREIVEPTLHGMRSEGSPFRGVLFVGLMIENDVPRVLEFNVRFGDPESSVLVPMVQEDWFDVLSNAARGSLANVVVEERSLVSVVVASEGYPASPRTGDPITIEKGWPDHTTLLHAGTRIGKGGHLETAGGRVFNVVAHGQSFEQARARAYEGVARVQFRGMHFRRDIGKRSG